MALNEQIGMRFPRPQKPEKKQQRAEAILNILLLRKRVGDQGKMSESGYATCFKEKTAHGWQN